MAVAYGTAGTLAGVTSGNITCAAPASIADGDLLVAIICANDTVTVSRTGWTALDNVSATSDTFKTSILWRIASGESGSYVFTHTSGSFCAGQVFRFTGTDPTTPINASSKKGSSTSGTSITSNTCTPTANNCLIAWFIGIDDNTVRVSAEAGGSLTWTEQVDAGNSTAALGICVATAPQTTAAGISPTATFSASNTFANLVLAIQPPTGGSVTITPPAGSLTLTGQVPTVLTTANQTIPVPLGTLTLTGQIPTVSVSNNQTVSVPLGSLTLTGNAPTVLTPVSIAVPAGALTLTGQIPTVVTTNNQTVNVPSSALTLTGLTPTVLSGTTISVPLATLTLTGLEPTIGLTQNVLIDVPAGQLTLTAFAPDVIGNSTQPGPLDSPRIAEGLYRRKKKKLRRIEEPESPVFISPASFERAPPQEVIDKVPNFATLAKTVGTDPAVLSAQIDREIEFLMRQEAERDDEEALVLILTALD